MPATADRPAPEAGGCVRKTILVSFRGAAVDLWGKDGLRTIAARMPLECRVATIDSVVIAKEWLPEEYVLAWYEAAWEGPAQRRTDEYHRFLDRMMDLGFGRVRKFLLGMATPAMVVQKAPELWRHDHSHGTLTSHVGDGEGTMTLSDHPYTTTPLARSSIAEIYRYAVSLARAKDLSSRHLVRGPNQLEVRLTWR